MLTKYASLEDVQVLELRSSPTRARQASLGKLADFHQYRTDDGFLYARIRAISSRVNKNHDGWPSVELAGGQDIFDRHLSSTDGFTVTADGSRQYGFSTFLGKPIFVDHHNSDPSRARGVIVDAKFHVNDHRTSSLDDYYASADVDPEHLPGTWVELLLEVDAKSFPKFAKAIVEGSRNPKKGIDGWSMGCDVERSVCSICKNAATSPEEYCKHVQMKGAYFDHVDPESGRKTSKKAYENCYGVSFFEISGVFDPADETALSLEQARTSAKKVPKKVPLKDLADLQEEEWIDEEHEKQEARKKKKGGRDEMSGQVECPNCGGIGTDDYGQLCRSCRGQGYATSPHPGGDGNFMPPRVGLDDIDLYEINDPERTRYGPVHMGAHEANYQELEEIANWRTNLPTDVQHQIDQMLLHEGTRATLQYVKNFARPQAPGFGGDWSTPGLDSYARTASLHLAENPLPQSEMAHAPEPVDTLREEEICPVCGSSMDEDTCEVCGYQQPPEGFDNPDLTKAQDREEPKEPFADPDDPGAQAPEPNAQNIDLPGSQEVNTPKNPTALAHVTSDMDWEVHTAARINKNERPLVATDKPATNEPKEQILSDQLKPVTSSNVRTARDFIAAVANKENNQMSNTKVANPAPPSNEPRNKGHHPMDDVRDPEVVADVMGVGGVMAPSNDEASKANAQVDVLGIGGTGVESVKSDEEGVKVDQGTEHSKNVESIPTKTWSTQERQHDPVTNEVPQWVTDSRWSHWRVEGHEDGPLEAQEQQGGPTGLQDGGAVKGVKPVAEQFGERVDVLQAVTSPSNNSGATTTWSGTDGNGVTKQQDPVTGESIALSESGLAGKPNWGTSSHVFQAFKLARLEVKLGMLAVDREFDRAAELERETPERLAASLDYAQRVASATKKIAGVQKLPMMGRPAVEKQASTETAVMEDESFMFGGV